MTLLYEKEKNFSPKSEEYYNKYYDKSELIKMLRDNIMVKNAIIKSRNSLKGIITRMKNKNGEKK